MSLLATIQVYYTLSVDRIHSIWIDNHTKEARVGLKQREKDAYNRQKKMSNIDLAIEKCRRDNKRIMTLKGNYLMCCYNTCHSTYYYR